MSRHHVEAFLDDDGWGWQCFEPECRQEQMGFEDLVSAESDGDLHAAGVGRAE